MKKQVIVVEGEHDRIKIHRVFPDIDVIITNGSEISEETLSLIYQTSLIHDVILFLDPDYPGKQITHKILSTQGHFSMAYIDKSKAISANQKKVGIEHASDDDIYKALKNKVKLTKSRDLWTMNDLIIRGLAHSQGSQLLRKKICKSINIPLSNAKTLLKFLNMLEVSMERIDEILNGS